MSRSPEGWYPQPDGRQQFWDGQQWTEHFAPSPSDAAAPVAGVTKTPKAWYAKKRVLIPAGIVALFIMVGALNGGDDPTVDAATIAADTAASPTASSTTGATAATAPAKPAAATASVKASPKPSPKPGAPRAPVLTSGQRNALRAAENYLELMGMSKAGLIQQLSSPAGDGYSKADATYAANHVKANWNAEAVEAAKNYMELMPMSRAGLIQQLSSSAGDEFTKAQATHAADAVL
jgi:predicted 3-demethylubiquinone-9 3-methyltransferase (glyoxalase superfamily)